MAEHPDDDGFDFGKYTMNTCLLAAMAAAIIFAFTCPPADAGGFLKPGCSDLSSCDGCEPCWCCQGQPKKVKRTRHCFDVECETICIPPVTLPTCAWFGGNGRCEDNCCPDDCGDDCAAECSVCRSPGWLRRICAKLTDCRIRTVHRIKRQEHDIEGCEWEWTAVCTGCRDGGKCCTNACSTPGSCCAPCGELSRSATAGAAEYR